MPRWVKFLLFLLLGLMIGLIYGWWIDPVRITDTSPWMLGAEYQTEMVLMVAEIYNSSLDLDFATNTLTILFMQSPGNVLDQAVRRAREKGYSPEDILSLQTLSGAYKAIFPGEFP